MTMPDPIGVSGPGAMSQRIDKQPMSAPTGLPYGEAGALMDAQRGAPMAATPPIPRPDLTGLSAPTANPDQPITAGAPVGEGPGPEVLTTRPPGQPAGGAIAQALARAAASDPTGELSQLLVIAQQKGL